MVKNELFLRDDRAPLEGRRVRPDQSAITVQPEDAVAYADLVETVDTFLGEQLRNVTVAPMN
jgi:hypothetical protein